MHVTLNSESVSGRLTQHPDCSAFFRYSQDKVSPAGLTCLVKRQITFHVTLPQVGALVMEQLQGFQLSLSGPAVRRPGDTRLQGEVKGASGAVQSITVNAKDT